MTFQLFQTQLQPSTLTLVSLAAATEIADQVGRQIVRVVVEIFTAKGNSLHHGLLGAHLIGGRLVIIGRSRVDRTDQRIFKLERLVAAKQHTQKGPECTYETTDES